MNRLMKTLAILVVALVMFACGGGSSPTAPSGGGGQTPLVQNAQAQAAWMALTGEERAYALFNMGTEETWVGTAGNGQLQPTGRRTIKRAGNLRKFWGDPRIAVSVPAILEFWRGVIPAGTTILAEASSEATADTLLKYTMEAYQHPVFGKVCFWAESRVEGPTYVGANLFFALGAPECKDADGEVQLFASGVHEAGHGFGFPVHTPLEWGDIMAFGANGGLGRVEDRMSTQFRNVVKFFWSFPPGTAIWPNGQPAT